MLLAESDKARIIRQMMFDIVNKYPEICQIESGILSWSHYRNLDPFGFLDYNRRQCNAARLPTAGRYPKKQATSDSRGFASGQAPKAPGADDKGNFIICGIMEEEVLQAVDLAVVMKQNSDMGSQQKQ